MKYRHPFPSRLEETRRGLAVRNTPVPPVSAIIGDLAMPESLIN